MGEIFHALEVLNRSMKLGLNGKDLMRAEMGFKTALAMQGNPAAASTRLAGDPAALAERYEVVTSLRPRAAKLSLSQLSTLANQAMKVPRTRVDAATFRKVDTAIAAATRTRATGTRATRAAATLTTATRATAATRLTAAGIRAAKSAAARKKKTGKRK